MRKLLLFLFSVVLSNSPLYAQLVLNEVSQGTTGSQEYVELLVLATNACSTDCVDIRGWIIDDNNGWHAPGTGTGIAGGVMRFTDDPVWECVPNGALIVVYNENDRNPLIPADDPDDSSGDCVYILPGNSTLLDRNASLPSSTTSPSYAGLTYTNGGAWTDTGMSNGDDSYHTVDPNNLNDPYHAVSWGNNTSNTIIYFGGSADRDVFSMANTVSNDPWDPNNWVQAKTIIGGVVTNEETPGMGNNADNIAWITMLGNGCMPLIPNAGMDVEICEGDNTSLTASGGGTYEWSTSETNANINVLPATTGNYTVTVTSDHGCTATDEVLVTVHPNPEPAIIGGPVLCAGRPLVLDAGVYDTYIWSNAETTQTINVTAPGPYVVTVTDSNGCTGLDAVNVSSPSLFFVR